jgi:hypothetical protein
MRARSDQERSEGTETAKAKRRAEEGGEVRRAER